MSQQYKRVCPQLSLQLTFVHSPKTAIRNISDKILCLLLLLEIAVVVHSYIEVRKFANFIFILQFYYRDYTFELKVARDECSLLLNIVLLSFHTINT